MNNKIKVLHIITGLPMGGAQDNTLYTLELLNKDIYEVTLACNASGEFLNRAKKIENCRIIHIDNMVREISLLKDFRATLDIIKIIKNGKYDIIHTHSSKAGLLGRIASWILGKRIIIHTVHGFPFNDFMNHTKKSFYMMIEKIANSLSTHLITVSKLNYKKIVDLKLAKPQYITNIYSGIDFDKFTIKSNNLIRQELRIDSNVKLIGFIGRLSDQKDPFTFLKAILKVLDINPDCHFILVGGGPKELDIKIFIQKNNLESKVTLLGIRNDIPSILHNLDLFVLSSIYEGLGRSMTEALYCKVPVIATDVEGVPELIQNNETGILVPPRNSKKLASAITYAIDNLEDMQNIAEKGHVFVNENFDVKKMVLDIDDLYKKLLKI